MLETPAANRVAHMRRAAQHWGRAHKERAAHMGKAGPHANASSPPRGDREKQTNTQASLQGKRMRKYAAILHNARPHDDWAWLADTRALS